MYNNWEQYLNQEMPRKHYNKNPSFSSVLLDQVFRSIDGDDNQVLQNIKNVKCSSFSDNDSMSFSNTSRSSSSSLSFSSVHSFSSETEYFSVAYKSSKPYKSASNLVHARTQDSCYHDKNPKLASKSTENLMIKSKSRAMKIYSNLRKMKQPISPGGKISTFINSLFTSEKTKKMNIKNDGVNRNGILNLKSTKATSSSSSTRPFPRSCLSKNGVMNSKAKMGNEEKRSVRFYPVSTIVLDDDSYPYGHRSNVEIRGCKNVKKCDELVMEMRNVEEVDDEDGSSDCSEDLFEIDHLGLFGNDRFCDELPVYATTHVNKKIIH